MFTETQAKRNTAKKTGKSKVCFRWSISSSYGERKQIKAAMDKASRKNPKEQSAQDSIPYSGCGRMGFAGDGYLLYKDHSVSGHQLSAGADK